MGIIADIVTDVATEVIKDTRDKLVVGAVVGTATAVTGAVAAGVAGVAKGVEAVGKAAAATKNAVGDAKEFIDSATEGTRAVVDKALEATVGDKDTRHYRKELRYLSKISKSLSIIVQKVDDGEDIFRLFDANEALLYNVRGNLSKDNYWLSVLDDGDSLVGEIYMSRQTKRAPIFHESRPINYVVEIAGEQVAVMKTKLSKGRSKEYDFEPYGWTVQDQKKDISISNEQGVIIHASKRKGYDAPTYILDFQQEGDELVSLMLMLTLISREFEC